MLYKHMSIKTGVYKVFVLYKRILTSFLHLNKKTKKIFLTKIPSSASFKIWNCNNTFYIFVAKLVWTLGRNSQFGGKKKMFMLERSQIISIFMNNIILISYTFHSFIKIFIYIFLGN